MRKVRIKCRVKPKIIQYGVKFKKPKRFTCHNCGCVYECNNYTVLDYGLIFFSECPQCKTSFFSKPEAVFEFCGEPVRNIKHLKEIVKEKAGELGLSEDAIWAELNQRATREFEKLSEGEE